MDYAMTKTLNGKLYPRKVIVAYSAWLKEELFDKYNLNILFPLITKLFIKYIMLKMEIGLTWATYQ